jgi:hypothetical protein
MQFLKNASYVAPCGERMFARTLYRSPRTERRGRRVYTNICSLPRYDQGPSDVPRSLSENRTETRGWCEEALKNPASSELRPDGRWRYWVYVEELGKYLRVVTLEDGVTIHNAFPDRDFLGVPR